MGTQISKVGSTTLEVGITPITSGAVGRVLFQGTGNVLQESANLFWDNANARLGIGTSSPVSIIHSVGSVTASSAIARGNYLQPTLVASANGDTLVGLDIAPTFTPSGFSSLSFVPFRVVNNAVNSTGGMSMMSLSGGAGTGGVNFPWVDIRNTDATNNKTQFTLGGGTPFGLQSRTHSFGTDAAGTGVNDFYIYKGSNFTYPFVISANGNTIVGSGLSYTDAGYKLDVNGTARVVSDANISGFTVGRGGGLVVGNTVVGFEAGLSNTTGNITAFGYQAGKANTTGSDNNAFGYGALRTASTAHFCSAFGTFALRDNTASNNVAIGAPALLFNTTGQQNCGLGNNSLRLNLTGNNNVAVGNASLRSNTSSNNVAIGFEAGYNGDVNANTTGSNNIFVGYQSIGVSATESNRTWIGNSSTATTWLGGNVLLGTTTDVASSICTLASTTKGFLPPRMTNAQRLAIATPAVGLIVYCTDVVEGLYINKSTGWTFII